jgi:1-deoxy-D-xylulose-5-phosphate synthase
VNMRFVKPLDEELVVSMATRHRAIVTLEENVTAGGAGSAVSETLAANDITMPVLHLGLPDTTIEHGSREDGLATARLDLAGLAGSIERWWSPQQKERVRVVQGA